MKSLLSNGCIEFFRDPDSSNVFFLKNGRVQPFSQISLDDAEALRNDLELHPEKIRAMENAGIHDPTKQLEIYAGCVFGAFDLYPDFVRGVRSGYEYTPCQIRSTGSCPYREVICNKGKLVMKNLVLTRRQVDVLSMTCEDITDYEASRVLNISVQTYKRHAQNIRIKTGIRNSKGLAAFAVRHHIC